MLHPTAVDERRSVLNPVLSSVDLLAAGPSAVAAQAAAPPLPSPERRR